MEKGNKAKNAKSYPANKANQIKLKAVMDTVCREGGGGGGRGGGGSGGWESWVRGKIRGEG